ncbi:zinc finger CCCH domain-containing protein 32-like [Magnolia sinica]|uniref:zinc finger CCCH domain-containing protein 32-like n=1 Tax=Magnolia sinica TaxID=86752 RepID=UPI002659D65B|nr:zinc finger CCCH domain-containing protein 32-like [Magnolia sinica]
MFLFFQVPDIPTSESPPERPGEPDCTYFLKTQRCKIGLRCKFNHLKDKVEVLNASGSTNLEAIQIIKKARGSLKDQFLDEVCSLVFKVCVVYCFAVT